MYKELKKDDLLKILSLPEDFHIDGFLAYGTLQVKEQIPIFKKACLAIDPKTKFIQPESRYLKLIQAEIAGKRIWYYVAVGGAVLSEYTHFASLFGSKKNILLGSCGGLDTDNDGDVLLVPTYSHGNESTTRFYQPDVLDHNHFSDKKLSQSLISELEKQGLYSSQKPVVTCQAMLAETWDMIVDWSKEGYGGVEMESSTLFAVSNHFSIPSAAVL
jgi:nucleoside phosphorylase